LSLKHQKICTQTGQNTVNNDQIRGKQVVFYEK